jgi:helix-turn-helix protein
MAEEKIILNDKYIKFVSPVPNLKDQRTEEALKPGYISITTQQVLLIPEKDNQPARESAVGIAIIDITDFDRKVELWKKALGASRLIPLHHMVNGSETVSLIATNIENALQIKKILSFLIVSGAKIDFVCPFSQGGKIFLDKQPVKGVIRLKKNEVVLSAEWLGKEQKEVIDLLQIDDVDIGDPSSAGTGRSSVTLKYQKGGTVISTLITSDDKITIFFDKYIKIIRGVSDEEEESIQLNEQQFMLVQMMYTSDIDAEMATEMLGVSDKDLGKLAEELVKMDILRVSGDDEFELTEKGTKYIVGKMKQGLG